MHYGMALTVDALLNLILDDNYEVNNMQLSSQKLNDLELLMNVNISRKFCIIITVVCLNYNISHYILFFLKQPTLSYF